MKSAIQGGELFLAIGISLLFMGLILWAILPGAGFPPLLLPAVFSVIYGGYCVWKRGKSVPRLHSSAPAREMLMMVRRRKVRAKS